MVAASGKNFIWKWQQQLRQWPRRQRQRLLPHFPHHLLYPVALGQHPSRTRFHPPQLMALNLLASLTLQGIWPTPGNHTSNSRNQEEQESIDAYVTVLRNLAKSCNFCDCMCDSLIRDRIILGVNNNAIRKKLLQVRGLTLNQCIDTCRSNEATTSQMKAISGSDAVHKICEEKKPGWKPPRNGKNDRNVSKKTTWQISEEMFILWRLARATER